MEPMEMNAIKKPTPKGIIIKIKNTHTIVLGNVVEIFLNRQHLPEDVQAVAHRLLSRENVNYVVIQPIDYVSPMDYKNMEIWGGIREGNCYYAVERIG
jgi:hypothetical protein